jgi:hypothetical protein
MIRKEIRKLKSETVRQLGIQGNYVCEQRRRLSNSGVKTRAYALKTAALKQLAEGHAAKLHQQDRMRVERLGTMIRDAHPRGFFVLIASLFYSITAVCS